MYWQPWHNSAWSPHHVSSQLESSHVAQDRALVLPLRLGLQCHGHHLATCTYHLYLWAGLGEDNWIASQDLGPFPVQVKALPRWPPCLLQLLTLT